MTDNELTCKESQPEETFFPTIYRMGEFAKMIKVKLNTIYRYQEKNILPSRRDKSGRYYFIIEDYYDFMNLPQVDAS